MNNDLYLGARSLAKGRIDRLHAPLGRRIECLGGSLWITQDGDLRDTVLTTGQAFEFNRRDDVLVSALDDSRYLLLDACASGCH